MIFALSDSPTHLSPGAAQALNVLSNDMVLTNAAGFCAFGIASGVAILRSADLPKWLGWLAILIGIAVLARAHNRDHKAALGTVSIMLIGLAVLGLSTGDHASQVGNWLGHLVFGI